MFGLMPLIDWRGLRLLSVIAAGLLWRLTTADKPHSAAFVVQITSSQIVFSLECRYQFGHPNARVNER
jgi:hypothetical protein